MTKKKRFNQPQDKISVVYSSTELANVIPFDSLLSTHEVCSDGTGVHDYDETETKQIISRKKRKYLIWDIPSMFCTKCNHIAFDLKSVVYIDNLICGKEGKFTRKNKLLSSFISLRSYNDD